MKKCRMTKEAEHERITTAELIGELQPILRDFFVADCRRCEDGLALRFPNGQKAVVAVWFESD